MAKLEIPNFRYIAQDVDGDVYAHQEKPKCKGGWWISNLCDSRITKGRENDNHKETLIDLETEDHDFTDGILKRIPK